MSAVADWPRTTRVLPWLVALLLVVIWLVPSDGINLNIPLPFDPHPDRVLLVVIAVLALATGSLGRGALPSRPHNGMSRALVAFAVIALTSLVMNADTLAGAGELSVGMKKLLLLVFELMLFFVVATALRPSELRNFSILFVMLASIAAVGTIWEYRTDYNVFYDLAHRLFSGVASVAPVPATALDGRADTFGPTAHGLAITTMLTLALPFAVLGMLAARSRWRKFLYGFAVALVLAGAIATLRKTSMIAPGVALIVLVAYRPRQMLRLAPFGAVLLVMVHLLAPGALGGVGDQLTGGFLDSGTTVGRTSDYEALKPDVATYPLMGRGYGTIDPGRSDTYRILDNQYLGQLVQTGFVGLGVYIALLLTALALAHRVIRRETDEDRRRIGLAAVSGFGAFAVTGTLFDIFSFWEVPYLFLFIAGLCSVATTKTAPAPAPARVTVLKPTLAR